MVEGKADEVDFTSGDVLRVSITAMAHGGEGIARLSDGRVVFVRGAYPGDVVDVKLNDVKKKFARAHLVEVVEASEFRAPQVCPAAELGAGCCDFGTVAPDREVELKARVLEDQLARMARGITFPAVEISAMPPHRGWRTRARFGVDTQGRAGTRKVGSNDLVTSVACNQLVDGLADNIVGEGARKFTPGAEVIAVVDSQGNRNVVETRKAPRGKRIEKTNELIEGSGTAVESVAGVKFAFPPHAFWQAHAQSPTQYSECVMAWVSHAVDGMKPRNKQPVAWDLYGGVGMFVPALERALRTMQAAEAPKIVSVDFSPAANAASQPGLQDIDVEIVQSTVESAVPQLMAPDVVILDPPRTGAGETAIQNIAQAQPQLVIHVGCDPATFARDMKDWDTQGFQVKKMKLFNAFPGTHHFEVIAMLAPAQS